MKHKSILIIGAGGIGGLLLDFICRAIAFSATAKVNLTIMDGDIVESRNLPHQRFSNSDVGSYKVEALIEQIQDLQISVEQGVVINPIASNFSEQTELDLYDLVIVAVDRDPPRNLVHSNAKQWLDLRARGDGFVMWSHLDEPQVLAGLPTLPTGSSAGCQLDEAIESGNIQFGFALAAAHGAQWVLQWLRGANTPAGKLYTIHMGELSNSISNGVIE